MNNPVYTIGADAGGSYIKVVLMKYSDHPVIADRMTEKVRKRNPVDLTGEMIRGIMQRNDLTDENVSYIATTGEGEMVKEKTGHFYGMTTHARGGAFLHPGAKTVVDLGALYVRAISVDPAGRVLDYKMTGQCASGSGQFIENISRYLGLSVSEIGGMSLQSKNPELPSGICAVLAETDVINMVSRGIATADIIKGIHLSIANRIVRLLQSLKAGSPVVLTGGMALNAGLVEAIIELLKKDNKQDFEIFSYPDSIYAGAIGAAIWGGYRFMKLRSAEMAGA